MRKFVFKKLVRDNIVDSMLAGNDNPTYHVLSDADYLTELQNKIFEEAKELTFNDAAEATKELADLQEVLDNLAQTLGITTEDIKAAQRKKNDKAGSFKKRLYVDTVELADDAEWVGYLSSHPDQYPEITP